MDPMGVEKSSYQGPGTLEKNAWISLNRLARFVEKDVTNHPIPDAPWDGNIYQAISPCSCGHFSPTLPETNIAPENRPPK